MRNGSAKRTTKIRVAKTKKFHGMKTQLGRCGQRRNSNGDYVGGGGGSGREYGSVAAVVFRF